MVIDEKIDSLSEVVGSRFPNREWIKSDRGWYSIPVTVDTRKRRLAFLEKMQKRLIEKKRRAVA